MYTPEGDEQGYFVYHNGLFIPVEFDFTHCFWYIVKYNNQQSCWLTHKLPKSEYGLDILDSEVTDRSEWGPINDGKDDSDQSDQEDTKSKAHPESIDIKIPTEEEEKSERQLEKLAEHIPILSRPRSRSATSRLPPITTVMATQTTTEPVQVHTHEEEPSSSACKGGGPPGDEPDPRWFAGSGFPYRAPDRGGEPPNGGGGPPAGGGGPPTGRGGDPNDRRNGMKLSGKEPAIFDGDRSKAEAFLLEWTIYRLLNGEQDIMRQPFSQVMLFLTFIKGPDVQEWTSSQVGWLEGRILAGAGRNEEHLYDTVMDSFNTVFTNTMSLQKAKAEFRSLKMEKGELDTYIAKFERLARMAGYNLQEQMVLDRFGSGLNPGLFTAIITNSEPRTWLDWTRAAQKYQQKYLLIRSALGMKTGNAFQKTHKKPQTPEQWKAAWSKKSSDPDAMDTTPGRTRARKIDADERTELMKAGKCFTCKKQGHLSRDCPQRSPQRPRTNAHASTSAQIEDVNSDDEEPAKVRSGKKKHSASEIIDILKEADEEAKDSIIQEFFMKEDF